MHKDQKPLHIFYLNGEVCALYIILPQVCILDVITQQYTFFKQLAMKRHLIQLNTWQSLTADKSKSKNCNVENIAKKRDKIKIWKRSIKLSFKLLTAFILKM